MTFVHSFDGKKVITPNGKGVIKAPLKKTNLDGQLYDNTVAFFRREYEDKNYSAPETIALWVDVPGGYSTINELVISKEG